MTTQHRIQHSNTYGWILKSPRHTMPLLRNEDKDVLINQLPYYFSTLNEDVVVSIHDDFGREMDKRVFRAR